jgi:galactokinase
VHPDGRRRPVARTRGDGLTERRDDDRGGPAERFGAVFGGAPDAVWRAPGRINVIGEHTDYNDGLVMPVALPLGVTAAVARRADGVLRVASTSVDGGPVELSVTDLAPERVEGWAAYAAGVLWALRRSGLPDGHGAGADVWLDGDVPPGAGLSSSAALECAVAAALNDAYGWGLDDARLVQVARAAENDFVGVPSGALDQSASVFCRAGCALLLDVRSGKRRHLPFDLAAAGLRLLVVDTGAPHRLVDGEYARRRADCARAAEELGVPALRDVDAAELPEALGRLADERLRKRVRHVVTENGRVAAMARLVERRLDPSGMGRLLTASHVSLRDDFEVSSRELDLAVETALAGGAYGARMTGGGFGGSAIALVDEERADEVADTVRGAFAAAGAGEPRIFPAIPSRGVHRLT